MPSRPTRILAAAALLAGALAFVPGQQAAAQDYYFVTNLDPYGDNWLALRTRPSTRSGSRIGRLGPDTVLDFLGERSGPWMRVMVMTGPYRDEVGWVHGRYVGCCTSLW